MIPSPRDPNLKWLHISAYMLHSDLVYLIPTIQLDLNPLNKDHLHIRIYLFVLVIQIEFISKQSGPSFTDVPVKKKSKGRLF